MRQPSWKSVAVLAFLAVSFVGLVGCEPKGPAERAGESIDRGVRNAKDAIDPAGPAEKAGRAVDRAVNP